MNVIYDWLGLLALAAVDVLLITAAVSFIYMLWDTLRRG